MRRRIPAPETITTPTPEIAPTPATILRAALRAQNMTNEDLWRVAGLSRTAAYRVLRGERTTARTRRDVARAVGLADDALEPHGGSK